MDQDQMQRPAPPPPQPDANQSAGGVVVGLVLMLVIGWALWHWMFGPQHIESTTVIDGNRSTMVCDGTIEDSTCTFDTPYDSTYP